MCAMNDSLFSFPNFYFSCVIVGCETKKGGGVVALLSDPMLCMYASRRE